jgi:aldehyde:ferredoxin oxidoreductase
MECFEKGLLTLEDTGGLDLSFGNGPAVVKCVELIGRREGIGALLSVGAKAAATKLGGGARLSPWRSRAFIGMKEPC